MPSWLTAVGENRYLYYIGWNRGVTVPFRNSRRLGDQPRRAPFERMSIGPVDPSVADRALFRDESCVLKDGDGVAHVVPGPVSAGTRSRAGHGTGIVEVCQFARWHPLGARGRRGHRFRVARGVRDLSPMRRL